MGPSFPVDLQRVDRMTTVESMGGGSHDHKESLDIRKFRRALLAEALGTFIIVIFGVGSVVTAVTTGAQAGIWQVAVVWGFGVTLAILCTAEASGAHLNPAVTMAFLLVRPNDSFGYQKTHASIKALLYVAAQMSGAILGGVVNLALFGETIAAFERLNNIERGQAARREARCPFKAGDVSTFQAMCIEAWGTCVLCFVIFVLTHPRNPVLGENSRPMVPYFIGFTVACLISLAVADKTGRSSSPILTNIRYAPLTQAGWNPARDFGPRLVAAAAGWGRIAIPGPRGGFWVYIVGPLIGGPVGAFLAEGFAHISLPEEKVEGVGHDGGQGREGMKKYKADEQKVLRREVSSPQSVAMKMSSVQQP
eukprot:jgi/Bigna1/84555/fgenesh1_pg.156_\